MILCSLNGKQKGFLILSRVITHSISNSLLLVTEHTNTKVSNLP